MPVRLVSWELEEEEKEEAEGRDACLTGLFVDRAMFVFECERLMRLGGEVDPLRTDGKGYCRGQGWEGEGTVLCWAWTTGKASVACLATGTEFHALPVLCTILRKR